jgi:hypothetical protein
MSLVGAAKRNLEERGRPFAWGFILVHGYELLPACLGQVHLGVVRSGLRKRGDAVEKRAVAA